MIDKVMEWLGNYHPVVLHFPIALSVMTCVSEVLHKCTHNPLFDHASRFMIISAALTAIPTALLGFAFSYNIPYTGPPENYFWWHRFFGIITPILAVISAILKELYTQKKYKTQSAYYSCLFFLFISVNLAGYFGGSLTFGQGKLWPPPW